jgi:hypothetical protein
MVTIVLFRTPSGYLARYSQPVTSGIGGAQTQPMPFPRTTSPEQVVQYMKSRHPDCHIEIGNPEVFWQDKARKPAVN